MRVLVHQDGLSSGWYFIRVVFRHGSLLSGWSFINIVFYQGCFFIIYCVRLSDFENAD